MQLLQVDIIALITDHRSPSLSLHIHPCKKILEIFLYKTRIQVYTIYGYPIRETIVIHQEPGENSLILQL